MRSGIVTPVLLGLIVAGLAIAYFMMGRGGYTRLKDRVVTPPTQSVPPLPGGQDAIVLTRMATLGDLVPQFLSVTLLPGRGMQVLQITAFVPGRGEVKMLTSEDLVRAAGAMTGKGDDAEGGASLLTGGPFLTPWAGTLGGMIGADGKSAVVSWRGLRLNVPAHPVEGGSLATYGGMLLKSPATEVENNPMPDGEVASATFDTYASGWPSKTETKVSALLASRAVEFTVVVKNVGQEATPVGIGWAPRFSILSGDRDKVRLSVPASMREVTVQGGPGKPTGELDAVKGTDYDLTAPGGVALGRHGLDDTFVHLKASFEGHPAIEMRNPAAGVGVRISALTSTIKAIHVSSPVNAGYISVSPQMNLDDPFGKQWGREDTGMVVLAPGQAVVWRVRVELFRLFAE